MITRLKQDEISTLVELGEYDPDVTYLDQTEGNKEKPRKKGWYKKRFSPKR